MYCIMVYITRSETWRAHGLRHARAAAARPAASCRRWELSAAEQQLLTALLDRMDKLVERAASKVGAGVRRGCLQQTLPGLPNTRLEQGMKRMEAVNLPSFPSYQHRRGSTPFRLSLSVSLPQGVKLMVDAEQSYLRPAIDHVVTDLMRRHNAGSKDGASKPEAQVFISYQVGLNA
jgi:hypothetical protein